MRAWCWTALFLAAGPAAGQTVERETFAVVGWNDACSVAIQQFGYAALGAYIKDEPVRSRIGTITIPPGEDAARTVLTVDWTGARSWERDEAKQALVDLIAAGYKNPGFPEDIRAPHPGAPHPFEDTILSTATFALRAKFKWPGGDWSWDQVRYSLHSDCGLFIFSRLQDGRPFYRTMLLRFYNPAVRNQRAQAHLTNSRLLFEASDLEGALGEAASAAHMQPELASPRYRYAVMLCLSGHLNESVAELTKAVRLDPKLAAQARADPDFYEVYDFPRFRTLVGDKLDYVPEDPRRPRQ